MFTSKESPHYKLDSLKDINLLYILYKTAQISSADPFSITFAICVDFCSPCIREIASF